ncbi:alkene reductase [Antarcticibacterium flavum]|uniref:Alkene reductase n=1 Tax=Antarcticibacterium flavum TaxID=2058175 RepID=A0A5B7X263_9FLAO|nr:MULTISPECIES: alkene reductase [Antarcticibacterium]MCM4161131.1 alkene reductase [Antarcticibacterium sp. W02-3]QCY69370.1 alkene reductase [Antarcticibacterium flavum]
MNLLTTYNLKELKLNNRVIMAPLTRARATNNVPNDLMLEYYTQRAQAGLIISEGTAPSPNGLGYARIPGIYTAKQIAGWKKITTAVHKEGGKIFLQIMHTGRVSHQYNMEEKADILAPSAIALEGEMYTDQHGPQPYPVPRAMTKEEIKEAQEEFVQASLNAIEAGFDGVEVHSANGYLADQFLNTATNKRTDEYGGTKENRCKFTLEVIEKVTGAIGSEKVGIRLSPYSAFNGTEIFEGLEEQFLHLTKKLNKYDLAYLHLVDNSALGSPDVAKNIFSQMREIFENTLIMNGGFTKEEAEKSITENKTDLVSFGRTFLANPDLVYRFENNLELNEPDYDTFYTPGEKGYTDYPFHEEWELTANK